MVSQRCLGALSGGLIAGLTGALMWYFTVDDALISARVAHHLATGVGYRFNPSGAPVDAVTPLGWAHALMLFASSGPLSALVAAKVAGWVSWIGIAVWLGAKFSAVDEQVRRYGLFILLATCIPLSAWAVAGMETGVVAGLATVALSRRPWALWCAGLACAWRPELIPWASVLAAGRGLAQHGKSDKERFVACALNLAQVLALPVCVLCLRLIVFGTPAPLSVYAKPSDVQHGLAYVLFGLATTGPFWLLAARRTARALPMRYRVALFACAAHAVSLVLAGGDWMVLSRLLVPILPSVFWIGAEVLRHSESGWDYLRLSVGLVATLSVAAHFGPTASHVGQHRRELIARAVPHLAQAQTIAALDVGWVGVAAPQQSIVDLAGVTDPLVAYLPGSHTAKRLDTRFLDRKRVDTLVLLLGAGNALADPWWLSGFERPVERLVARLVARGNFRVEATLPLGGTPQHYVVLRRALID